MVFYSDSGRITGRNPIWEKGTLTTLMWMFERVILYTNLGKAYEAGTQGHHGAWQEQRDKN